jgi:hypothetical protein
MISSGAPRLLIHQLLVPGSAFSPAMVREVPDGVGRGLALPALLAPDRSSCTAAAAVPAETATAAAAVPRKARRVQVMPVNIARV